MKAINSTFRDMALKEPTIRQMGEVKLDSTHEIRM